MIGVPVIIRMSVRTRERARTRGYILGALGNLSDHAIRYSYRWPLFPRATFYSSKEERDEC